MYEYFSYIQPIVQSSIQRNPDEAFLNKLMDTRYVYYTESDQVLYFNDIKTLEYISTASNGTSVILGRRRYKQGLKYPFAHDKILARGPGCGREGFFITGEGGVQSD